MPRERKTLSDAVMKRFVADPSAIPADYPSTTISMSSIRLPSKRQPRRFFDPDKMAQLVASVREHGILEPLLVRPVEGNQYELIAGERRLRAAQQVGLLQVPVVSREFSDQEALQVTLIENLQRDDLNPVEETEAVLELLAIALNTTTDEVKSSIYQAANAKSRRQELKENVSLQVEKIESFLMDIGKFNLESLRTSRLPLLNLPSEILDSLREGKLEYTKARAIARVKDNTQRQALLQAAIQDNLSLSQIRERIQALQPEVDRTAPKATIESLSRRLVKAKLWEDPKKWKQAQTLLEKLEALVSEDEPPSRLPNPNR